MIIDKIIRLNRFYQENTKFALCSLNPHAGEDGILGDEEIEIIIPAVKKLRDMGIDITNPLPCLRIRYLLMLCKIPLRDKKHLMTAISQCTMIKGLYLLNLQHLTQRLIQQ